MAVEKQKNQMTLAKWIINEVDGEAYRSGKLTGTKHPKVDEKMIRKIGSLSELILQAEELKRAGLIDFRLENMGADIERIHVPVESIEMLCDREGVEDPRKKQLHHLEVMEQRLEIVRGTFLVPYYEEIIEKIKMGKKVSKINLEDDNFFRCLQTIAEMQEPVWRRIFSAGVFGDSKKFENEYQTKVLNVLTHYSPYCEDGMEETEILRAHGINTYSLTMEWKGSVQYELYLDDEKREVVDTSINKFGTVLNEQTLEHAYPVSMKEVKRILIIENKANYEDCEYKKDTLYLYCHGFFSPKERVFLRKLIMTADEGVEYFHWGDMDFGGLRIFKYNRENIFPSLLPYKMDGKTFLEAVDRGAGIPLETEKRKKLKEFNIEELNIEELSELKQCILESGVEIEQEMLIAQEKIKR